MPALRQELRLLEAAPNRDGSPAWMIHDPVVNRFYRIGWLDFELLLRWGSAPVQKVLQSVNDETTLQAGAQDVEALGAFLQAHDLLQAGDAAAVQRLAALERARRPGLWHWLLHHYLFFRIPLIRPQAWLPGLARRLAWLYTPAAALVVLALSMLGVLLALRQWDTFAASFVDNLSWQGALGFAAALVLSKALHEMGHAVTATRLGVRVAHMGVAVLVLFPMLYTDTTESWKLRQPRHRLAVASAGIVAELGLAGLATLAWSLVPDGMLRGALFYLATTGWVMTVAVNASPFMRFDGYFIACDLVDLPNLHERSGAQARTWLRRTVLGLDMAWPEHFEAGTRRALIAFALATWIYRFVLYLSIAVLVYAFFFKLLGIVLMLVEIWWFVMRPLQSELKFWWQARGQVGLGRRAGLVLVLAALGAALVLPWHGGVSAEGWLHPMRQQAIHAPLPGVVVGLPEQGAVAAGQPLFVLESPDLRMAAERAQVAADTRARELVGLAGMADGEERRTRTELERGRSQAEVRLHDGQRERLQLAAPFAGRLVDLDPLLAAGTWVHPRQPLAMLIDPSQWVVDAFVAEDEVERLRVGDRARVQAAHDRGPSARGEVVEIDRTRIKTLPHRMLDSRHGGPIATVPGAEGQQEPAPRAGLFRVRIRLAEPPRVQRMEAVHVVVDGQARSLLGTALAHAGAVLVRESGF